MNRDDVEKLLGGHAAGTLTPGERQALYEAALEDQHLFDSLAADEPLRELLRDPAAKAQLLAALDDRPAPWYRRLLRPALGVAAAAVMVLLAVFVRDEAPKPEPVVVAETRREPVRAFQPPVAAEKTPLPTALQSKPMALPPPPALPAPAPSAPALDAIAPVAPEPQKVAQALPAGAAESDSSKPADAPVARQPAFRALNLAAAQGEAAASRLGLQYTIYKKSPAGELTPVDPQTELERSDEVVIRFQSAAPGLLSVSQLDAPNSPRVLATDRLLPSVPYTFPRTGTLRSNGSGTSQFLVRFSPQPQSAAQKVAEPSPGQAGAVAAPAAAEAIAQPATFNITLKYK